MAASNGDPVTAGESNTAERQTRLAFGSDFDVVPTAGVPEDSVTGSAHAVLTPLWADLLGRSEFTAHQASVRGGSLSCRLEGETAWLGGPCVTVVEGSFTF